MTVTQLRQLHPDRYGGLEPAQYAAGFAINGDAVLTLIGYVAAGVRPATVLVVAVTIDPAYRSSFAANSANAADGQNKEFRHKVTEKQVVAAFFSVARIPHNAERYNWR